MRIVRSVLPPIYLFEDIADLADWPLLISAEQKSNPRLMESIGHLVLVPPDRRVAGPGASYLMALSHTSARIARDDLLQGIMVCFMLATGLKLPYSKPYIITFDSCA